MNKTELTAIAMECLKEFTKTEAKPLAEVTARRCMENKESFDPDKTTLSDYVKRTVVEVLDGRAETLLKEMNRLTTRINTDLTEVYVECLEDLTLDDEDNDYERLAEAFGPNDQPLLNLLIQGFTITESAALLGRNRSATHATIRRIRERAQRDSRVTIKKINLEKLYATLAKESGYTPGE